jgi:hypothetical protein
MNITIAGCVSCCILVLILSTSAGAADTNSWDLFTKAIQNHSTAPNYVLITVVDDNNKQQKLVCTEAPFLLGAIHRERQIFCDEAGSAEVEEIALGNKDRTFHFSRADALKNMPRRYDEKILGKVRSILKDLSDDQIRKGFRCDGKGLDKLYMNKPKRQYSEYRDAIAHVLLERGLLPRRGCVVGCLTVDE